MELTAHLSEPGLVVLADVFYPGWRLSIDGKEAEILRVNRMMRGAAVEAGRIDLSILISLCHSAWGWSYRCVP